MRAFCNLLVAGWLACAAQAASIDGVVLDSYTNRPLARALVTLQPVQGGGSKTTSVRANSGGQYHFNVDAGQYLLRAARAGFAPFKYGQKDWKSAGKPVAVEQDGRLFLEIHLHRYGAISGTVLDENEIGIPDQPVVAYRAQLPLAVVANALTDDRGVYRFHGLDPGTYYVRSVAHQLEDGSGLLPTFQRQTTKLEEAGTVDVDLDQQIDGIDVKPEFGKLYRITGKVNGPIHPARASVALISDAGRLKTASDDDDKFEFDDVAPGKYELLSVMAGGNLAAFQPLIVDNDADGVAVNLTRLTQLHITVESDKGAGDTPRVKVMARPRDLDGPGEAAELKFVDGMAAVIPGRWEVAVTAPQSYYVSSPRVAGWNEIEPGGWRNIRINLSSHPAALHGLVTGAGHEPVVAAPVYLETFDADSRQRLGDLRTALTDVRGRYSFHGLAPGNYRILSSFEYDQPDSPTMEAAGARSVSLSKDKDTALDLDLYVR